MRDLRFVLMLDDGDGQITYEEFIIGVSRLKGQARAVDLIAKHFDTKRIYQVFLDWGGSL